MSQSTEKSLGQVAHETGERVGRWARRWSDMGPAQRDEWEQIAQAVAAVVREQAAQVCDGQRVEPAGRQTAHTYKHEAMTDDKMREAFEVWARENFMHVERHPSKPTYVNCTAVAECWAAWQACAVFQAQEIEALRADAEMFKRELLNIADTKRFKRDVFDTDSDWADWAQSRARYVSSGDAAADEAVKKAAT